MIFSLPVGTTATTAVSYMCFFLAIISTFSTPPPVQGIIVSSDSNSTNAAALVIVRNKLMSLTTNITAPTTTTVGNTTTTTTTTSTTRLVLLQNGTEFDDVQSYQYAALQRTSQMIGVEYMSTTQLFQYYTLFCIYEATNGVPNFVTNNDPRFETLTFFPQWLFNDGWTDPSVNPCGGTSGNSDGFYGITCDTNGRVIHIDLSNNVLTGQWPPEIVYLSSEDGPYSTGAGNLQTIDLYRNEFVTNGNDTSWLTLLGNSFETFMVQETAFGGDIPRLPDGIVNFNIAETRYTGGLTDANFENLTSLVYLDMDGNKFEMAPPSALGRLPSLQFFYCSDCFLIGDLSFMEGMPSIVEFWMDANLNITGPIPDFLGQLTTLQSLSIAYNSLSGYMPTTLGTLTDMRQLWAYANQLNGEIPSGLGELTKMSILQLEGNAFVGSMPESVCDNTVFPTDILDKVGADCNDILFVCPCCTCCDIASCLAQDSTSTSDSTTTATTSRSSDGTGGRRRLSDTIHNKRRHLRTSSSSIEQSATPNWFGWSGVRW